MRRAAALLPLAAACYEPTYARSGYGTDSVRESISAAPLVEPAPTTPPAPCPSLAPRTRLGDGLTAERRPLEATPALGLEPCFDVVRAAGTSYHLRLLTKARDDGSTQPAPEWRERHRLVAVTNAGMFHAEGKPVGLLIEDGVALSKDNSTFGGYLAFGPRSAKDPAITITGRDCAGFDLADLKRRYTSILQANRLVDCKGDAMPWKDAKQYSAAAIGLDHQGDIIFIHARAAVTMTELARSVASLDLAGALFLEGGPEASLVVRGSDGELSRVGSYETGFVENDENKSFWWLPNVLALEAN